MIIYSCYRPKEQTSQAEDFIDDLEKVIGEEFGFAESQASWNSLPQTGGVINTYSLNDGSQLSVLNYESTEVLMTKEIEVGLIRKQNFTVLTHKPKVFNTVFVTLSSDKRQITDRVKEFFEKIGFKSQTYVY